MSNGLINIPIFYTYIREGKDDCDKCNGGNGVQLDRLMVVMLLTVALMEE